MSRCITLTEINSRFPAVPDNSWIVELTAEHKQVLIRGAAAAPPPEVSICCS